MSFSKTLLSILCRDRWHIAYGCTTMVILLEVPILKILLLIQRQFHRENSNFLNYHFSNLHQIVGISKEIVLESIISLKTRYCFWKYHCYPSKLFLDFSDIFFWTYRLMKLSTLPFSWIQPYRKEISPEAEEIMRFYVSWVVKSRSNL